MYQGEESCIYRHSEESLNCIYLVNQVITDSIPYKIISAVSHSLLFQHYPFVSHSTPIYQNTAITAITGIKTLPRRYNLIAFNLDTVSNMFFVAKTDWHFAISPSLDWGLLAIF